MDLLKSINTTSDTDEFIKFRDRLDAINTKFFADLQAKAAENNGDNVYNRIFGGKVREGKPWNTDIFKLNTANDNDLKSNNYAPSDWNDNNNKVSYAHDFYPSINNYRPSYEQIPKHSSSTNGYYYNFNGVAVVIFIAILVFVATRARYTRARAQSSTNSGEFKF